MGGGWDPIHSQDEVGFREIPRFPDTLQLRPGGTEKPGFCTGLLNTPLVSREGVTTAPHRGRKGEVLPCTAVTQEGGDPTWAGPEGRREGSSAGSA